MGEIVADALVRHGHATSPLDLFSLTEETLANLNLGTEESPRRFGEKNAAKVIASLEVARSKPLNKWLFAMGVRHLGESAAKELSRLIPQLDQIPDSEILEKLAEKGIKDTWVKKYPANPKNEEITDQEKARRKEIAKEYRTDIKRLSQELEPYAISPELGGVAAQNTLDYFKSEAGRHVLDKLSEFGINPLSDNHAPSPETSSLPLSGKTFVITGTLSQSRDHFKDLIEKNGGKVSGSISKNTHYLLAGESAGSKLDKATQLGVRILDEDSITELLKS
jgi:DNA ligase (NAD+)